MSGVGWARVRELFERALEQPPAQRRGWLRDNAAGDASLLTEVESLLAAHEASGDFLESPPRELAAEVLEDADADPLLRQHLGPYVVERRIGRGGAGTVYAASRHDGTFSRQVAIKVLRRGLGSPDSLRRFTVERRILAGIDHPNIARLLDAGTTPDGRPYLVMELVDGEPIDGWCDARGLGVTERLRLFLQVCAAVQLAHQNLVVHRDLKPGNIMVSSDGTAKLLDFGIAKLLDPDSTADETVADQRVLTIGYASPEQIRGGAVTTASDVFSLGVVLYGLLSGARPFRVTGLLPEQREATLNTPPPPPSVVAPPGLRRALAGDLDTIVLMALRPEPERRYASVRQFAEDIERYLEGRPVTARSDALSYRASKFVRRHSAAVAAATALAIAAIIAVAALAVQSRRIAAEAARAGAVNEFLQEILRSPDPTRGLGGDVTVVEALLAAVPRIDGAFASQPDIEAEVRHGIALTLLRLGIADGAAQQFTLAVQLRRQTFGDKSPEVADSLNGLGEARFDLGDLEAAERHYRDALEIRRGLGDDAAAATVLDNLGNVFHERGDLDEAERLYREAQALWMAAAPDSEFVATSLNNLAVVAHDREDLDTAEALYAESLAMSRRALGNDHPDVAISLGNLAAVRHDRGDLAGAEPLYREAVEIMRRVGGAAHPQLATSLASLGMLMYDRDDLSQARQVLTEAATILRGQTATTRGDLAWVLEILGDIAAASGAPAEARARYAEALDVLQRGQPLDTESIDRVTELLAGLPAVTPPTRR